MTAYAISLISNRKLLIKVDFPCKIENFLLPNEVNWVTTSLNFKKYTHYVLDVNWNVRFSNRKFLKINFNNFQDHKQIIIFKCGLNLVKHLTFNKQHHKKIESLGYNLNNFTMENLFYKWWNELFILEEKIDKKLKSILLNLNKKSNRKLICAQIRLGVEGDPNFFPKENTQLFWKFLRQNFIMNSTNYKLFVTTDTEEIFTEAISEFGSENIIGSKYNSIHIDKLGFLKDDECKTLNGGMIDFMILGHCDMGVISHSGFGILGLLNRKNLNSLLKNFYIYTNPDVTKKRFFKRKNLFFGEFNSSILYLEFISKLSKNEKFLINNLI